MKKPIEMSERDSERDIEAGKVISHKEVTEKAAEWLKRGVIWTSNAKQEFQEILEFCLARNSECEVFNPLSCPNR